MKHQPTRSPAKSPRKSPAKSPKRLFASSDNITAKKKKDPEFGRTLYRRNCIGDSMVLL
jgi:hypothetical protein